MHIQYAQFYLFICTTYNKSLLLSNLFSHPSCQEPIILQHSIIVSNDIKLQPKRKKENP